MTIIEFIRRNHGLSQIELARRAGIYPTAIVQVERGHRKPWPKLRTLFAIELGMLEEELFNINGWPYLTAENDPYSLCNGLEK